MKTFAERYENEILTDNTKIELCKQCVACKHWGNSGKPWDNSHDKASCDKYPTIKPDWVINNYGECYYYEEV